MSFKKVYPEPDPKAFNLRGRWKMVLTGPDGNVKQEVEGDNVVCTNGKEFLASFLASATAAASTFTCRYIGIGTNATGEAASDTALGTELARVSGVVSYVSNQVFRVTATFTTGVGTGSIVEYGLFSSSTAGTMLTRDTESVITKGAADTLTAVCNITIS